MVKQPGRSAQLFLDVFAKNPVINDSNRLLLQAGHSIPPTSRSFKERISENSFPQSWHWNS